MSANPTTLQAMLTLLRQRTNMENNQFVTDAELISYLNNSLCLLDGILISKYNDYKLTLAMASVVPGTNYLALPDDFLKLKMLEVNYTQGQVDGYLTLSQYGARQKNRKPYPTGGSLTYGPYQMEYRLEGNKISLIPFQSAAQWTYRISYAPDYVPLVNTTDTLQSYMDSQAWYEYAICDSAVKILAKQDLDPSIFMAQAAELKNHIIALSAPNRNAGEPAHVVDFDRGFGDHGGGWGWSW